MSYLINNNRKLSISGYNQGYHNGIVSGITEGFQFGYNSGVTEGFPTGFNSGSTYTYPIAYSSGFTNGSSLPTIKSIDIFLSGDTSDLITGVSYNYIKLIIGCNAIVSLSGTNTSTIEYYLNYETIQTYTGNFQVYSGDILEIRITKIDTSLSSIITFIENISIPDIIIAQNTIDSNFSGRTSVVKTDVTYLDINTPEKARDYFTRHDEDPFIRENIYRMFQPHFRIYNSVGTVKSTGLLLNTYYASQTLTFMEIIKMKGIHSSNCYSPPAEMIIVDDFQFSDCCANYTTSKEFYYIAIIDSAMDDLDIYYTTLDERLEALWIRNPEWLPIPEISANEQVLYMLMRVDDSTGVDTEPNRINKIRFQLSYTGVGTTTVDWGDGIIEVVPTSDAVQFSHSYEYNTCSGQTTEGYRQALIKVSGNANIIGFISTLDTVVYSKALDIVCRLPFLTTLVNFAGLSAHLLERVCMRHTYTANISLNTFVSFAFSVQKICLRATNPTALSSTFANLYAMRYYCDVAIKSPNAIACNGLFINDISQRKSPKWFPLIRKTIIGSCFQNNSSIKVINFGNISDLSAGNTTTSVVTSCTNLSDIYCNEDFKITGSGSEFTSCSNLVRFNGGDTFYFNCANLNSLSSNFNGCTRMKKIVLRNRTGAVTIALGSVFANCILLQSITSTFSFVSNASTGLNAFSNCAYLENIDIDFTLATTSVGGLSGWRALRTLRLRNINPLLAGSDAISIAKTQMDRDAIVQLFNDLPSRSTTTIGTLTITAALGASALTAADRLILTSKNYTIVG